MVDEVLSRNLLTDGPALYQMLQAALSSLTVSPNLSSLTDMAGLALSLRDLDMADVTFMTTPFAAYPQDPNRLVFTSEVGLIWERMAADEPITGTTEDEPGQEPSSATTGDDPETSTEDAEVGSTDDESSEDSSGATSADELASVC